MLPDGSSTFNIASCTVKKVDMVKWYKKISHSDTFNMAVFQLGFSLLNLSTLRFEYWTHLYKRQKVHLSLYSARPLCVLSFDWLCVRLGCWWLVERLTRTFIYRNKMNRSPRSFAQSTYTIRCEHSMRVYKELSLSDPGGVITISGRLVLRPLLAVRFTKPVIFLQHQDKMLGDVKVKVQTLCLLKHVVAASFFLSSETFTRTHVKKKTVNVKIGKSLFRFRRHEHKSLFLAGWNFEAS